MASIPSLTSSSAHFSGIKFPSDGHHNLLPSRVTFRPLTVSAACSTSTAERTSSSSRGIASPGSSLYEVLGIQSGASFGEIKSAYRKLARVLHPDVAAEGQKENRAYEFMKIRAAYETLSDPEKRSEYNRSLFRPVSSSSSPYMSSATAATVASYAASGFSRSPRRRWETDQCW